MLRSTGANAGGGWGVSPYRFPEYERMEGKQPCKWTYSHLKRPSHILTTRAWPTCCLIRPKSFLTCKHGRNAHIYAWMQLQGRALGKMWNVSNMTGLSERRKIQKEREGRGCNPKTFRSQWVRLCQRVDGETAWRVAADSKQTNKQTTIFTLMGLIKVTSLLLFPLHAEMTRTDQNGPQSTFGDQPLGAVLKVTRRKVSKTFRFYFSNTNTISILTPKT